jgi:DNA-binding transcriptional LysR family regulator
MTRSPLRRFFRHGFFPQLVAFEACARHGSVTRAAEELSLAQPTVSCLIRKLSDTVGGPVLEPQGRRMAPTALGRELLALCDEVFDSVERFGERRAALCDREQPSDRPAPAAEVSSGA